MTEKVRFHFDPLCPWAWQSFRWMQEVQQVRDLEVEWRFFSLEMIHAGKEDPLADVHARGTPSLRAMSLVRREHGNDAVRDVYDAIGTRIHEKGEDLTPETVEASLEEAGLDRSLLKEALDDESTIDVVRTEHSAAVDEVGAFGVPTIVLSSGRGIFGPVIAQAPTGETAGEVWDHVAYLADFDGFFELKRERDRGPGS